MVDVTPNKPAMGRRERKRLETRQLLARTALELFDAKGFDSVTIAEIAEKADLDASTFFRHFSSKEAVIYAEYEEFLGKLSAALRARPAKEPLFTSLKNAMGALVDELAIAPEDEYLRMRLGLATPALRAQTLMFREDLTRDFAIAIAERMDVDVDMDSRPYLLSSLWVVAADWHRENQVRHGPQVGTVQDAIEQIAKHVLAIAPVLKR